MNELRDILAKYRDVDIDKEIATRDGQVRFSASFYRDVAEIYDAVTRIRNIERNPTGFDLNDAPILGLLIRMWKILKEVVRYYKEDNAQIIGMLDRPFIEAAIIAKYLLIKDAGVVEDYRKCSYKDRLRVLRESVQASESEFAQTPAGVRLLESIRGKMARESLTEASFETQRRNNWRLQGKRFFDIFKEVERSDFYKFLYGIPSESIHGSWNDSMDYDLRLNDDGTYSTFPFYQPVDIRFVTPLLRLSHDPYLLWLRRIEVYDEYLDNTFKWIGTVNAKLYDACERAPQTAV